MIVQLRRACYALLFILRIYLRTLCIQNTTFKSLIQLTSCREINSNIECRCWFLRFSWLSWKHNIDYSHTFIYLSFIYHLLSATWKSLERNRSLPGDGMLAKYCTNSYFLNLFEFLHFLSDVWKWYSHLNHHLLEDFLSQITPWDFLHTFACFLSISKTESDCKPSSLWAVELQN